MEYLHNGLLFSYKVPKHTTWVHLENIMLNEKSQTHICTIPVIRTIQSRKIQYRQKADGWLPGTGRGSGETHTGRMLLLGVMTVLWN